MITDPKVYAPGGLALFAGGTNPLRAGIEGALISGAIEYITHAPYSHSGIVPPERFWPDGQPWLIESTIEGKVSGPQFNALPPRLQSDYAAKGGHAWLLPFQSEFEPDWNMLWQHAQHMIALQKAGKLHYSVARLFADATARDPLWAALPAAGAIDWLAEHYRGIVCSECAGFAMEGGGVKAKAVAAGLLWLPNVKPIPGQVIGCAPGDLHDMPLYQTPIQLV